MSSGTENRQRTEQVNVRLTPQEAEQLRAVAKREGVTPATILRRSWAYASVRSRSTSWDLDEVTE